MYLRHVYHRNRAKINRRFDKKKIVDKNLTKLPLEYQLGTDYLVVAILEAFHFFSAQVVEFEVIIDLALRQRDLIQFFNFVSIQIF